MRLQICEVIGDTEHLSEETIQEAIASQKVIEEWAYILHDKDIKEDGTAKNPHWHIELRLKEARTSSGIAKWFGVSENFVSACKSKSIKSLKFNDMLAYTVHAGKKDKHQYDLSKVKTNITNLKERIDDYIERLNGKPVLMKKNEELERIINMIAQGEIREFEITDKIDANFYAKYTTKIKNAFEYRRQFLRNTPIKKEVYYFCGASGAGKTTYAKEIAKSMNLSYFVSGSQNDVLDGYAGQDVIILDDLRPSSFEISDLLKFLDNDTNTAIKSRFHNKVLEAKIIIITSIMSMEDFFYEITLGNMHSEPIEQFKRRCSLYAEFNKDGKIYTSVYNEKIAKYETLDVFDNPVLKKFPKLDPTEERREHLRKLFTIEIIQEAEEPKTNIDNQVSKDELSEMYKDLPFY